MSPYTFERLVPPLKTRLFSHALVSKKIMLVEPSSGPWWYEKVLAVDH